MLSQNLRSLADHLRPFAKTGLRIEPSEMMIICAIIEDAVDDAEELEACAIPAIYRLDGTLPENVVRFRSGAK